MIKSGNSISDLLFSKENKHKASKDRLIITPIIDKRAQLKEGSSSIDVRLGCNFKTPIRSQLDILDPMDEHYIKYKERYFEEIYIPIGSEFILHPRQFALGQTLEWIHLPNNLCGLIMGRSTWGREGLVIATASGVQPGYSGPLTLELTNLGEIPLKLYPGLSYAQLFVISVEQTKDLCPGDICQFIGTTDIKGGIIPETEMQIIRKFRKYIPIKNKEEAK